MPRFYKTASATPLDYMYRINTPLMEKVLLANDEMISSNINQLGQLENVATAFPYLQQDEGRAKEISDTYSKRIDEVTQAIREDPANWRKQLDPIRGLSKELQTNYKTGEIGKIMGNFNLYKGVTDYLDKSMDEYNKTGKGVSADRAMAYKQSFLNNFTGTGYDANTGQYNRISVFNPMNNMDIRKSLSEELDKMKADGTIRITDQLTGSGEYFNKETQKWEGITPEKILRIATGRLNNPQLMEYLKQDSKIGLVRGVFDMDQNSPQYGQFISPYNYDKTSLTSSEQSTIDAMKKQIEKTKNRNTKEMLQNQLDNFTNKLNSRTELNWNKDSYLAPILRGIMDEYSYQKVESANDLSANSIWQTRFNQANINSRHSADIDVKQKMQDKALASQKALQDDRLAAMKEIALLKAQNKLKPNEKNIPKGSNNAVVGNTYTTPFYWTTEDKEKMTVGLQDEIMTNDSHVKQLETTLADIVKNHPEDKILIANAENQVGSAKAKLNALQARREDVINYAVNEWKAKGAKATNEYSDFDEKQVRLYLTGDLQTQLSDATDELKSIQKNFEQKKTDPNWLRSIYYPTKAKVDRAQAAMESARRLFTTEIKPYSDNKLEKAAKETTNSNVIVSSTDSQDQIILDMINATPSNYKIRNKEGKEINLSFEHGTATPTKENLKIKGVSATTGLGDKGIEVLASIKGSDGKYQDVIITPVDDGRMNNYFSGQFRQSKDKDVNSVGKILGSPTAGVISDMMTEMRMNTSTSFGTKDAWVYKTIPNPANPRETIKVRARSVSAGAGQPKWEFQFETSDPNLITKYSGRGNSYSVDGKTLKGFVPLASTRSPNGEYSNLEDVISIFPEE